MTVTSYTDENFSSESHAALSLPINPGKVMLSKGIQYAEDRQLGSLNGANTYVRYQPETFSFECLFDGVGALEPDNETASVHDMVKECFIPIIFTISGNKINKNLNYIEFFMLY